LEDAYEERPLSSKEDMRILPFLAIPAILTGGSAYAQVDAETKGAIELTRRAIQANRQAIVNTAMDLTDQESEAYWRLYKDWRAKMACVGDRKVDLLTQIDEHYDELSDQRARAMLDEWLKIETDMQKLM